jgi:hypothetical protein
VLLAITIVTLRSHRPRRDHVYRRLILFAAMATAVSIGDGLTIFL